MMKQSHFKLFFFFNTEAKTGSIHYFCPVLNILQVTLMKLIT